MADFNFTSGYSASTLDFNFTTSSTPMVQGTGLATVVVAAAGSGQTGVQGAFAAVLPLSVAAVGRTGIQGAAIANVPLPEIDAVGEYDSNVFRGLVHNIAVVHEEAERRDVEALEIGWENSIFCRPGKNIVWRDAKPEVVEVGVCLGNLDRLDRVITAPFAPATPLGVSTSAGFILAWPQYQSRSLSYQAATPLSVSRTAPFTLLWPLSAEKCAPFQPARPIHIIYISAWQPAQSLPRTVCTKFQEAQYPQFIWPIPTPETPEPEELYQGDPHLNLKCPLPDPIWGPVTFNLGATDICLQALPAGWLPVIPGFVPRRVIIVTHDLFIKLLADDSILGCADVNLSIDRDTWGWSWDATLKARRPELLETQHDVEISIDGHPWRGIIEDMSGSRQHGHTGYKIGGRSLAAQLSAPFTAPRSRTETADRTAIQLAEAELSGTGWTLDWQALDWLVNAGCFSYSDLTPIGAIKKIAGSIDAIVQAHPVNPVLTVLPRYSVSPWNLAAATPDITIPADILRSESVSFQSPALMRGVWVSGQSQGVRTRVYRTGSDGAPYAQMIVDPLITTTAAARERGRSKLSATGRRREVSLPMLLVPELGVLTPGLTTEISEPDGTWRGYIDAVKIAATRTKVTQTATIEHVLEF